jgi:hypothetical protein
MVSSPLNKGLIVNRLLRVLRKMGVVGGYALFRADAWVELLLVRITAIAMLILSIAIAWGIIEGRYSIVWPFKFSLW